MAAVEMAFFLCLSISSNNCLLLTILSEDDCLLYMSLSAVDSSSDGFVSVEIAAVDVSSSPLDIKAERALEICIYLSDECFSGGSQGPLTVISVWLSVIVFHRQY